MNGRKRDVDAKENIFCLSREMFFFLSLSLCLFDRARETQIADAFDLSLFRSFVLLYQVFSNTRIVRAAGSSNGSNANNTSNNNNASDSNKQNNKKRAHRVRSTMSDFQQQQKPYTSYREKHGYNWTYGSAEDDESAEYGTSSSSSSSSSSPVSEADAREAARNWLCTIGRQGQTSPIDFGKVEYDASRSKNVSENFRGTLLDDPFTNNPKVYEYMRARRGPMVGKLGKALRHVHGDEAYESYLGKHVNRHIRLARILKLWRINFHIRFGREPGYDDMPSNLKSLELQYINIGFKLRQLDG